MGIIEQISDFLNPQKVDISLYTAISELVITKIKGPIFSIIRCRENGTFSHGKSDKMNIRSMESTEVLENVLS